MKKTISLLLLCALLSQCASDKISPITAKFGEPFTLRLTQSATLTTNGKDLEGANQLKVGMTNVEDGCCPKTAQCIAFVMAKVTLSFEMPGSSIKAFEFLIEDSFTRYEITYGERTFEVIFQSLTPYPDFRGSSDQSLSKKVATFIITPK